MAEGLCIVWLAGGELRVLGESTTGNGPVGGGEQRRWVEPPRSCAFLRIQTRPCSLRGGRLRPLAMVLDHQTD
jgi:hypothetical protein